MSQEIERKYLVKGDSYVRMSCSHSRIKQGYICSSPGRTVRVRICDDAGFLTIKGASNLAGTSRYEWECEIPLHEAEELMSLCEPGWIDKVRYQVRFGEHVFEVDEFYGDNQGLVIAEIELKSEDEKYECPDFLGEEVTGQLQYYNTSLMKHPFKYWEKENH